jgi:hypothetical protein
MEMIKPRLVKLAVVEGVDKLVYQNELELKLTLLTT